MKGNTDLIRIVAIAAAFLAMFGVIGISIHSINSISSSNQRNQEKKEGEDFAVIVAQTTATTSVWDYLRSKETTTEAVTEGETVSAPDGSGTADTAEGEEASEAPAPTEAPTEPTDLVIQLD